MRQLKNCLKFLEQKGKLMYISVAYLIHLGKKAYWIHYRKKGNYFILDWPKRLKNQVKAFPDRRNSETDNKI